jgi:alkylated DNA repair dioxygenase AlkB
MGSFYTQLFLIEHGKEIAGAVLSATSGKPDLLASAGRLLARGERLRLGARGQERAAQQALVRSVQRAFKPNRTGFDWLSRDPAEVDKYIADPLCGFVCTTSLWVDLLDTLAEIADPRRQRHIPKDVPRLPVRRLGGPGRPSDEEHRSAARGLPRAGLKKVTHRYYPGGRHEMLNETNRDEVVKDLLEVLSGMAAAVAARPRRPPRRGDRRRRRGPFNCALANLYRDGHDAMGWHADDEPELGPDAPRDVLIASVSLGAPRRFVLRHRRRTTERRELELGEGSLLVMGGTTQHRYQHAVPRTAKPVGPRMNLTFRLIRR